MDSVDIISEEGNDCTLLFGPDKVWLFFFGGGARTFV